MGLLASLLSRLLNVIGTDTDKKNKLLLERTQSQSVAWPNLAGTIAQT